MMAYSAQTSCRPFGSNKCPSHTGQEVSFVCMDCDSLVCMRCVTSKDHKGHVFEDLGDIVKKEADKLKHNLKINEENYLPSILKGTSDVEKEIAKNKEKHREASDLIKSRVREIKEEAEKQGAILIQACTENETKNHIRLLECQTTRTDQQRECQDQITNIKKTLQSGTEIEVFDLKKCTDKTYILCPMHSLELVTYQPRTSAPELVKQALGSLDNPNTGQAYIGRPVNGQAYGGQPVYGQAYIGRPVNGQAYGGQPVYGQAYGGQPVYGQAYGGQPVYGQAFGRRPVYAQERDKPDINAQERDKPDINAQKRDKPDINAQKRDKPDINAQERDKPDINAVERRRHREVNNPNQGAGGGYQAQYKPLRDPGEHDC
ncbi:uncharacterized protein LOC117321342 isoform X3 [Pecten maximus]|uniref:uncharacterized protein LOC117321342 isoform X3 n=1 Tax=Pecten maximus TaxID=6579 RepID=UPI001458BA97|nr:uncharacterized protein LOC117321342 isoform X3 [Pecten maximus]